MTCSEEVAHVFEKAKALLDKKEEDYGDAWKVNGRTVCIPEVFRKANYIRVRWEKGRGSSDKLMEDLLDLINWAVFAYHLECEGATKEK